MNKKSNKRKMRSVPQPIPEPVSHMTALKLSILNSLKGKAATLEEIKARRILARDNFLPMEALIYILESEGLVFKVSYSYRITPKGIGLLDKSQ